MFFTQGYVTLLYHGFSVLRTL